MATHLVHRQVFFSCHTTPECTLSFLGLHKDSMSRTAESSLFGSCRPLGCSNSCLHSESQGLGRRTVGLLEMMNGSWKKKKEINKLSIIWRSMRHIFRNGIDYLSLWWCSKVNLCLCSHLHFLCSLKAVAAWKPCHPPPPTQCSIEDDMSSELANRLDIILHINPWYWVIFQRLKNLTSDKIKFTIASSHVAQRYSSV